MADNKCCSRIMFAKNCALSSLTIRKSSIRRVMDGRSKAVRYVLVDSPLYEHSDGFLLRALTWLGLCTYPRAPV